MMMVRQMVNLTTSKFTRKLKVELFESITYRISFQRNLGRLLRVNMLGPKTFSRKNVRLNSQQRGPTKSTPVS
jgi:hypothetical protein